MIKLTEMEFNRTFEDDTGLEYQAYCLGYSHAVLDRLKNDNAKLELKIKEQEDIVNAKNNKSNKLHNTCEGDNVRIES